MSKKIKLTPTQQADYNAGKPVTITKSTTKWEPKGGEWFIASTGRVARGISSADYRNFGVEYQTYEQAEQASKKMRSHNRLLCWLAEHDDGFVEEWGSTQENWYVYLHKNIAIWSLAWASSCKDLGTIYMSKANAELLAKQLNEGIIEL